MDLTPSNPPPPEQLPSERSATNQSLSDRSGGEKSGGEQPLSPAVTLASLSDALRRLRSAIRLQLLISRLAIIASAYVGAMVLGGVVDYMLRFPSALRTLGFVIAVGVLAWLIRRVIVPVFAFRPSNTDLALRLEQTPLGQQQGWPGVLASGLELAQASNNQSLAGDARLASAASQLAATRFSQAQVQVLKLLDPSDLRRGLLCAALAGATVLALSMFAPSYLKIGTQRVLLPWTSVQWPKRTGVMHADQPVAHPLGASLPLRAILTRSARAAESTRVEVTYRVLVDKREVTRQRALLTPQGKRASVDLGLGGAPIEGDLFERLLDVQALLPSNRSAWAGKDVALEYQFATSDDSTQPWRVAIVEPPAITSVTLDITPPAYLERVGDALSGTLRGSIDAGNGLDARSDIGPVLAGSQVRATLQLSKPLPAPPPEQWTAWGASSFPGFAQVPDFAAQPSSASGTTAQTWLATLRPEASVQSTITLRDQFGIEAREQASLRLDVMEDRPPTATIIDPPQDESVLPTAQIPVTAEGRDDVAVWHTTLQTQLARVPAGSVGAPAEPLGEPAAKQSTSRDAGIEQGANLRVLTAGDVMDLSSLALNPGDEVWLTARVLDAKAAFAASRSPQAEAAASTPSVALGVVSPVRRLRIISEAQFVEQIRAELAGLRDAARRLEQDQRTLGEERPQATDANLEQSQSKASAQSSRQQTLSERVEPVRDALERLAQRAERNALPDPSLTGLLKDAQATADAARERARDASGALRQLASERDAQARDAAAQQAAQAQQQAQEELATLSDMLGQSDDSWTVRRQLEQLLSDQRQLRSQTAAAGQDTAGQELNELTQKQREDLDRLSRRQQELSQRATQALDQAQERANQLEQNKSAEGQPIREAVQRARARQLAQRQQQASEQIRQNQTGGAQQSQQQAEQALEEALEALDDQQKAQDEQLRRALADILQSLEQLIAAQQTELDALARALDGADVPNLDAPMVRLQQNTLGVAAKARTEAEDATRLANLIDAAAEAQAGAIVALRASPANLPGADQQERASLQRLKDARDEAQRLDSQAQQRDDDRVRRDLRKAYAQALEQQTALRAEARALLDEQPTRRTRGQARRFGDQQDALRQQLDELRSKTQDLRDAKVFDFAHTRLDRAMGDAAGIMREGEVSKVSDRNQASAIAILRSLVEALKENKQGDGLQNSQGGGGGSGAGQQPKAIPELAELMLLRGMQQEAADRTRALAEEGADAAELDAVSQLQDELARQAASLLERLQQQQPGAPQMPADEAQDATRDPAPNEADKDEPVRDEQGTDQRQRN